MRIGLEDNTRDALHFVALGAGVLLVLRLLVAGVQLLLDAPLTADLPALLTMFRNGYLLHDPNTLVIGGMELPGRLAVAGVFAAFTGIVLAIAFGSIAHATGHVARKSAIRGGRAGLLLAAAWGLYAALILPPSSVRVQPQGLLFADRPALLNAMSLPWPGHEHMVPWTAISTIEQRAIARSLNGCGTQEQVVALTNESVLVIADVVPRGPDCEASLRDARERTARLAELLNLEHRAAQDQ